MANLNKVKFSMPIWPGLSPDEILNQVIPTLQQSKRHISDLYFTSRIDPFMSDAMGGIIVSEEQHIVINNAIEIGKQTGIPISATFNNKNVVPSYSNYKTFIKNFTPLYEAGIKTITIPFTTWMRFGLKNEFPELFVKNTILHNVSEPAVAARLFEEGFDYINLDRNLMRNKDRLEDIVEAKRVMEEKLNKKLYLSLLFNENCAGYCGVQEDHFNYNFNRTIEDPSYFESDMKETATCIIKDDKSAEYILKAASIPAYYSHINYLTQYIDVFKLHGRESKYVFFDSLNLIYQFTKRGTLDDAFHRILSQLSKSTEKKFLKHIENCKFDCWKCSVCDNIAKGKNL